MLARQPAPPAEEPITETGKEGAQKWFDRGLAAYGAKDYPKAYEGFMHAYKLFPQPQFIYNAAAAKHLGGEADEAIALYDRYLAEAPDASDAERVRKAIEKLKGKPMPEGAPEPGDTDPPITETGTPGAQKWFDRGLAAYQAKNYPKAYNGFMHAYHLLPQPEFLYNAAAAKQLGGDVDAAIAMYDRYLAEAPGASDAPRVHKALEKLRQKELGGKVDDAGGGSQGDQPDDNSPITATGTDGATQWFDRGQRQFAAGKYEDAVQSFGKAFDLDPKPDFVFNQGAALEKESRPAAAAAAFEHYLALSPSAKDYKEVVQRTKKLREQAKSDPIADPWADEAAGADPTATGLTGAQQWFDKGQAAFFVGDYKAAHADFMHAYEDLHRPEFLYNAAAALDMDGDAAGAIQLYRRYLDEKPGASDAVKVHKRIDKLNAKLGGGDAGAEPGEPPIEEGGKEGARKWYERGEKQFRAGKFEDAVHSFQMGFDLGASPAFVFDQGVALEAAGRPAAAAAAFERYLALKPDSKNHGEVIERIKKLRGDAAKDPIVDPWADEAAGPDPTGEGKEGAKQWFQKASVSFEAGDYKAAHSGFMHAFDLSPHPAYLFDAARALDEAGDAAGALALYERSLSAGIKDPDRVHRLIDALKERTAAGGGGGELTPP
jgi:tetratricopeptide (TPR) repeat protein